jgi:hypothetical protein
LNVLGRAQLQRTVFVVVALLLAAGFTSALARDVAPVGRIGPAVTVPASPFSFHRVHAEGARRGAAKLIERIRKVE